MKSLRDLWDPIKYTNMFILEVPKGQQGNDGAEITFQEIMAEHYPNLMINIYLHVQKAKKKSSQADAKRTTPR